MKNNTFRLPQPQVQTSQENRAKAGVKQKNAGCFSFLYRSLGRFSLEGVVNIFKCSWGCPKICPSNLRWPQAARSQCPTEDPLKHIQAPNAAATSFSHLAWVNLLSFACSAKSFRTMFRQMLTGMPCSWENSSTDSRRAKRGT